MRNFTVAFPDNVYFIDAPYASAVAEYLRSDQTELPLTVRDALALIPQLSRLYELTLW